MNDKKCIFDSDNLNPKSLYSFGTDDNRVLTGVYIGKSFLRFRDNVSEVLVIYTNNTTRLVHVYTDLKGKVDILQRGDEIRITLVEIIHTSQDRKMMKFRLEVWK